MESVTLGSRVPLMAADALAITVTWFALSRGGTRGFSTSALSNVLLRDGESLLVYVRGAGLME